MDASTIDELYRRYGPVVLRRARAILGDEEMARDVLQEVFVKVVEQKGRFRGEASPMTWIYRITTNLCLNRLRDGRRRAAILEERAKEMDPEVGAVGAGTGGTTPSTAEARLTLEAILQRVPEELWAIAVYYHVDHMTHAEIAQIMGVSRRTIGYRLEEFRRLALAAAAPLEVVR